MGRFRSLLFIIAIAVLAAWILSGFWATIFVEALWFDQLGFNDVFWTTIWAKFATGLVFGLMALVGLGVNVYLARYFSTRLTELHLFNEEMSELEQLFSSSKLIEIVTIIGVLVISAIMGLIGLANWDGMLRISTRRPSAPRIPYSISTSGFTSSPCRYCISSGSGCCSWSLPRRSR